MNKRPQGADAKEFVRRWQESFRHPDLKPQILTDYNCAFRTATRWASELSDLTLPTPETQVVNYGDHHAGEITTSFNADVYRDRVEKITESVIKIKHLHQQMYPITNLVINVLGDMVHGENPKQGAKVESIELGANNQIYKLAIPTLKKSILNFREEYKTITINCVPGNHGKYSREAPSSTNWDLILYQSLASELHGIDGIRISLPETFYQLVDIEGWRFILFHGHQVMTYQGIPFAGLKRKVLSWYITLGGFQYALCGHWHEAHNINLSSETELFINGALPSDDPYALEIIGTSSAPKQWTFGVHPEMGVTWRYPLFADTAFLPKRGTSR